MKIGATIYSFVKFAFLIYLLFLLGMISRTHREMLSHQSDTQLRDYIVQANNVETAVIAVEQAEGTINSELKIINAVATQLTPQQLLQVESNSNITRVWEDGEVQGANEEITSLVYYPTLSFNDKGKKIRKNRLAFCGDKTEKFRRLSKNRINHNQFMSFQFELDHAVLELEGELNLHFVFEEKDLETAVLELYQASTDSWYSFPINVQETNKEDIFTIINISSIIASKQDADNLEVRFFAAQKNKKRGSAKVDCIYIDVQADTSLMNVNAASVWTEGNLGDGIGVAVIDSGVEPFVPLNNSDSYQQSTWDGLFGGIDATGVYPDGTWDDNGHGTTIASMISNNIFNPQNGEYFGVAPDSHIVPVSALDENGSGRYSNIIYGI